jgi:nucleotide-binding universal stress UspA family protein
MNNVLVPLDFSASTSAVVAAAENLARGRPARIILLTVTKPPVILTESAPDIADSIRLDREKSGRHLAGLADQVAAHGLEVEAYERFGPPVDCILEEARRIQAEYIVMGSHGHSAVYELFVGSTTAGVLKRSPCPVLIVPR